MSPLGCRPECTNQPESIGHQKQATGRFGQRQDWGAHGPNLAVLSLARSQCGVHFAIEARLYTEAALEGLCETRGREEAYLSRDRFQR